MYGMYKALGRLVHAVHPRRTPRKAYGRGKIPGVVAAPSDEGAARVGARIAGTNSSVLIVGRLLFVWDLESHH
jgi:hypothetical protein